MTFLNISQIVTFAYTIYMYIHIYNVAVKKSERAANHSNKYFHVANVILSSSLHLVLFCELAHR